MADAPIPLGVRSLTELPDSPTTWWIKPNAVNSGFSERGKYRIRKPAGADRLLIDDEAIETDDGEWVWSLGFYAGRVLAELLGPDDRIRATYRLDVSPHPTSWDAICFSRCSVRSGRSIPVWCWARSQLDLP